MTDSFSCARFSSKRGMINMEEAKVWCDLQSVKDDLSYYIAPGIFKKTKILGVFSLIELEYSVNVNSSTFDTVLSDRVFFKKEHARKLCDELNNKTTTKFVEI